MKKTKKLTALFGLLLVCICLCSCGAESAAGLDLKSNLEITRTTDYLGQSVSAMETGVFSCGSGTLRYRDFSDGKWYVPCSNPGCNHGTEDCPAYVAGREAVGFGMYKDRIYFVRNDNLWQPKGYIELVSMKPDGTDVKVIKQWPVNDDVYNDVYDTPVISRITDVSYANGKAIITPEYKISFRTDENTTTSFSGTGIIILDLESGETLLSIETDELQTRGYSVVDFNADYVAVGYRYTDNTILSFEEFDKDEALKEKYINYGNYHKIEVNQNRYSGGLVINLNTMEIKDVFCEPRGSIQGISLPPTKTFYGMMDESVLIYNCYDYEGLEYTRSELVEHNIETGEERIIAEFPKDGYTKLWSGAGYRYQTCLFDQKTKILLRSDRGLGYLDLKTGETSYIHNDKNYNWALAGDLYGEYEDYVLLSKYRRRSTQRNIYIIEKDDFLNGKFLKAKKIN